MGVFHSLSYFPYHICVLHCQLARGFDDTCSLWSYDTSQSMFQLKLWRLTDTLKVWNNKNDIQCTHSKCYLSGELLPVDKVIAWKEQGSYFFKQSKLHNVECWDYGFGLTKMYVSIISNGVSNSYEQQVTEFWVAYCYATWIEEQPLWGSRTIMSENSIIQCFPLSHSPTCTKNGFLYLLYL